MLHPIVQQLAPSAEQRPAIVTRGVDVVVTAGAGTGKTRTLTARALALLAEGLPVRSIVAVTFTVKAAREMRNRLGAEIARYLARTDLEAEERTRWNGIARDLDAARIGTIHALCSEILRTHPAEAQVDPAFSVLDEGQAAVVVSDTVYDTLAWAVSRPEAAALFPTFGASGLRRLIGTMLSRRLALAELFAHDGAAARLRARLDHLLGEIKAYTQDADVHAALRALRAAAEYAEGAPKAQGDAMFAQVTAILGRWDEVEQAAAAGAWAEAGSHLARLVEGIRTGQGRKENWGPHTPKVAAQTLKEAFVTRLGLPDRTDPALDQHTLELLPLLRRLYDEATARLAARKAEQRALDFDDLEQMALQLLRDHPDVRTHWRREVRALLVDEFQDTNSRQSDLLRLLAGRPGVLFLVGDAKQSIYRFRGADVRVFRSERRRIGDEGGTQASLSTSYRTHAALLDRLNALLRPVLGDDDSVPYREPFAPLGPHRAGPEHALPAPFIELHLVQGTKGQGALEAAARALAQRLLQLNQAHGVAWGEVAILCRRASAFQPYEDALEQANIPYVTVAGRGFYQRPEVRDALNALRALADPTDDLALAGFLRSPVIGFTDAELVALYDDAPQSPRGRPQPGSLWAALRARAAPDAQFAVATVERLHRLAGRATVADLLKAYYDATGYPAALLAAGQARAARNLAKLLEDAHATRLVGVGAFLQSVESLRAAGTREGEAHADEQGAVQIMTTHAAKGLEFPVVAIGDVAAAGGGRSELLLDEESGLLPALRSEDGREGVLFREAKGRAEAMEQAENDRLLYVAATRARDLLLLSGYYALARGLDVRGWLDRLAAAAGLYDLLAAARPAPDAPVFAQKEGIACTVYALSPVAPGYADAPPAEPEPAPAAPDGFDPHLLASLLPEGDYRAGIDARPYRAWRVVRSESESRAPGWVVGIILHEALAAWRFGQATAAFDAWARARVRTFGVLDDVRIRNAVQRVQTLLHRFQNHPLHAEIEAAAQRFHELPYYRSGEVHAARLPTIDLLYQDASGAWTVVLFKSDRAPRAAGVEQWERWPQYCDEARRDGAAVETLLGARPRLLLCLLDAADEVAVIPIPERG